MALVRVCIFSAPAPIVPVLDCRVLRYLAISAAAAFSYAVGSISSFEELAMLHIVLAPAYEGSSSLFMNFSKHELWIYDAWVISPAAGPKNTGVIEQQFTRFMSRSLQCSTSHEGGSSSLLALHLYPIHPLSQRSLFSREPNILDILFPIDQDFLNLIFFILKPMVIFPLK